MQERLGAAPRPSSQPVPGAAPRSDGSRVDKRQAWIQRNADQARRALARCEVRAELAALLGVDGSAQQRAHRLEAARRELEKLELRWRAEGWEP
jgi:hypothetical protein